MIIVHATGFLPLSLLTIVLKMIFESNKWHGILKKKNVAESNGERYPRKS